MDKLLYGNLPAHISIEVVVCQSKSAVDAMYFENGGEDISDMWLIHPGIVRRSRGLAESLVVQFAEWSAALDERANDVLQAAAASTETKAGVLALVRYQAGDAPAMVIGMADLRSGMMEGRLIALGVDPARLVRETKPLDDAAQGDRIELVIRQA
jgi:hypothetical protein